VAGKGARSRPRGAIVGPTRGLWRDGEVALLRQILADGPPQVDAFAIADLPRLEPHWRDLAEQATEPNPFAESAFLISATRRIAPRSLTALCVWRAPDRGRLDTLAILRRARAPFGIVDVWRSELAPLAALLMDGERAVASLEAIAGWLARERPAIVALGLPNLDVNGKLARALRTVSRNERRSIAVLARISRPRLRPSGARNGGGSSADSRIAGSSCSPGRASRPRSKTF
jgi:hypothetical protein